MRLLGEEAPLSEQAPVVAVVGGGASGVIAALHLLAASSRPGVHLFEPAARPGGGFAFGCTESSWLLNVPAGRMSCRDDQPDDFLRWLEARHPAKARGAHFPFVPRVLYGAYLSERLEEAAAGSGRFHHHRVPVNSARRQGGRWVLRSGQDEELFADFCVIATGYSSRHNRSVLHATGPNELQGALEPAELPARPEALKAGSVLILGTGLTAIDLWRSLRARGRTGPITMLSRRGLLPLAHPALPLPAAPRLQRGSPRSILREMRALAAGGIAWPALADSARLTANENWAGWTARQRRSFLSHLRPYWDIARHRVPGTVLMELQRELAAGHTRILKGRIAETSSRAGQVVVRLSDARELEAAVILLAHGVPISSQSLSVEGLAPCPLGLGFEPSGAPALALVGPAGRSSAWESTAVPEIRAQCANLARLF